MNWSTLTQRALAANARDKRTGWAWTLKLQAVQQASRDRDSARTQAEWTEASKRLRDWLRAPVAETAEG